MAEDLATKPVKQPGETNTQFNERLTQWYKDQPEPTLSDAQKKAGAYVKFVRTGKAGEGEYKILYPIGAKFDPISGEPTDSNSGNAADGSGMGNAGGFIGNNPRGAAAEAAAILADKKVRGQSAFDFLKLQLTGLGIGDLVSPLEELIKEGISSDEMTLRLMNDPKYNKAYKARFAANDARIAAGLRALSPAEYSDIFNQAKVNFDERSELVKVVANAIGRRQDQLIINALAASSTSNVVTEDEGGTDTGLNVAKLRAAKKALDKNNVPMDNRHIIIHANSLSNLLSETAVTSADFNTVRALVSGELNTFLGFTFHTIGDRDEGGLAIASSERKLWAFHRDAIGYAEGIAPRTEINYIPEKTSWLVNAVFSAGAIAIDAEGIVEVQTSDA